MPDSSPPPGPQPSRRDLLGGMGRRENLRGKDAELKFGPLFHFSSNAMGCEFQVLCSESGRQPLATCVADGFQLIADLESQLSIYKESSELSAINRTAFVGCGGVDSGRVGGGVIVESRLFELLQLATEIHKETNGAFDVTSTPLTKLWKQRRQRRTLPAQSEIEFILTYVDGSQIGLDRAGPSIMFKQDKIKIDLGGIGKGFALDRLKEFLLMSNCENFLIHGGQSSVIGCGERISIDGVQSGPWQIGISNPLTPGVRLATVDLNDRAIGTSGSGRQSFVVNAKRYGHIVDPRTGWPADHYLSVTVLASTAVLADALATAIFVSGPQYVQRICDRFEVSAILISEVPGKSVAMELVNLPDEDVNQVNETD